MFRYSFLALRKRWGVPGKPERESHKCDGLELILSHDPGKYVTVGALPSNSVRPPTRSLFVQPVLTRRFPLR